MMMEILFGPLPWVEIPIGLESIFITPPIPDDLATDPDFLLRRDIKKPPF
jgi:hypothetical protein